MSEQMIAAAIRLAEVLQRENAALAVLDLPRAAGMLGEKQDVVRMFAEHQPGANLAAVGLRTRLEASMRRLRELAVENQMLLQRALGVQTRVMSLIAQAIRPVVGPPRYGASGAITASRRPHALTLSAKA